jgi:hypothetical protein
LLHRHGRNLAISEDVTSPFGLAALTVMSRQCQRPYSGKNMDKRNPDGSYMNESEIVEDIVREIRSSPTLLDEWNKLESWEVGLMHFGAGMNIRSAYGLWEKNNPHFRFKDADDVSGDILEKVWQALHLH